MGGTRGAVALTGASGLLGRHLRPALRDRPVMLLGRRLLELERHEAWAPFDLCGPVDLPPLPPGSALCHLAYAMADGERNLDYTRHAIDAVNRRPAVEHVVMMSSASVYGEGTSGLIYEETPLRPDSDYARTKAACEGAWLQLLRPDCQLTVLRPTSILAADGPGIAALARDAVHRPLRGAIKRALQHRNSVHFVAVDNIIAAVRFVLDRAGAAQEIFVVSDDDAPENANYAAMQDSVRAQLGLASLRTLPLPRLLERPVGALLGKPLGVRRTFSAARLADAGFIRPARLGDEVVRTVQEQLPQALRNSPR
jgi:nucleoside-diphosphate-sugar epimerase